MSQLKPGDSIETEDEMMRKFLPTCFDETLEHLLNQIEPVDDEVQNSFGMAVETFPQLLPRAFSTLRKIGRRMEARNVAASQPIQEEEEEAEDEEVYIGNNIPEITH